MTVAELIEELRRFPAHLPVTVEAIEREVDSYGTPTGHSDPIEISLLDVQLANGGSGNSVSLRAA